MTFRISLPLFIFPVLLLTVLHTGCAPKLPSSLPVTEGQRKNVLARYQTFRADECNSPVDADISMDLHSFGTSLKAEGFIQIKPPDQFRLTIIDQVGRPAVILVGTKDLLTLVNSAKGRALIGTVSSLTREADNPLELGNGEIVSLLTGRLAPPVGTLSEVRLDRETGKLYWLKFPAPNANCQIVLFDPETQGIARHIITDQTGEIILDIRYSETPEKNTGCPLPEELAVTGESLGNGEITVRYKKVLLPEVMSNSIFEIDLPEHYVIERKE